MTPSHDLEERMETEPYRPANGTEGDYFRARFCDRCEAESDYRARQENPCPILNATMVHDVDEAGYPYQWIVDKNDPVGRTARCTAFKEAAHD